MRLEGRSALVTGGASGIGAATTRRLAAEGAAADAADILKVDAELSKQWRQVAARLAPYPTWKKPEGTIFAGTAGVEPMHLAADHFGDAAAYPTILADEINLDSPADRKDMMLRSVRTLTSGSTSQTLLLLGAPFIFRWMGGRGEVLSSAFAYANVAFSGAVSICMLNLLGSAVRGTGNMGLPAAVIVGSVIAHILISPVLIFGFGPVPALGPAGAGWGLIVPFGAGSLVLFAYLRSSRSLVTLAFRGVSLQWRLFAEILKVGIPGLINVSITNLSVLLLTGIAGHLGREVAIGYAMGARLEYILIPLAFGFGTTIVAMVGTNWGAKQYRRAREIAWTGAATVAGACATIGLIAALFPALWMGLFTSDEEIVRIGASYLRIVGPIYGFYGLGMALYFATQGFGSVILTVTANAVRLIANAACALVAIFWLDLGAIGFFVAVAMGFCAYAALTVAVMLKVKEPAPELAPQGCGRIASR